MTNRLLAAVPGLRPSATYGSSAVAVVLQDCSRGPGGVRMDGARGWRERLYCRAGVGAAWTTVGSTTAEFGSLGVRLTHAPGNRPRAVSLHLDVRLGRCVLASTSVRRWAARIWRCRLSG